MGLFDKVKKEYGRVKERVSKEVERVVEKADPEPWLQYDVYRLKKQLKVILDRHLREIRTEVKNTCVIWISQEIKDSKSKLDDAAYKTIVHILSKF